MATTGSSLRRRLLFQLLLIAALLAVASYFAVRTVADGAAEATQDNILGASVIAISDQLTSEGAEISVDIPYSAFSMLGSISEDSVFYRVVSEAQTITGYDALPMPLSSQYEDMTTAPVYYTAQFQNEEVRVAALQRSVTVDSRSLPVTVLVAQTRSGQAAIAGRVAQLAAGLGIGFFVIAGALSWLATQSALKPLRRVVEAVERRGPSDLRAMTYQTPRELAPLVASLNGFMARLHSAIDRTESFITEAAHHVRTPLATVRTNAEIALRHAETEDNRHSLRSVIRAVEESTRSADQLLDHALVAYRTDKMASETFDLQAVVDDVVRSMTVVAELKDVTLSLERAEPTILDGDRAMVESAVRNIIDNAIKYSPADSQVQVSLVSDAHPEHEATFTLTVEDTGRGLDGQTVQTLRKRFSRGNNVGDVVGSGLGLTIVEEVARRHNGRFTLTDRSGGGAVAQLELPAS